MIIVLKRKRPVLNMVKGRKCAQKESCVTGKNHIDDNSKGDSERRDPII